MAMSNAKAPRGRLNGDFDQLFSLGCIQTGADVHSDIGSAHYQFGSLFEALMIATSSNPCDGCPAYAGGKCRAFRALHSQAHAETRAVFFNSMASRATVKKCSVCGCRIRGKNHEEGTHHKQRVKARA